MIYGLLLLLSIYYLTRIVLIASGVFKEPVLMVMEKYGENTQRFRATTQLLFWTGLSSAFADAWASSTTIDNPVPLMTIGIVLLLGAWLSYDAPQLDRALHLPGWYQELAQRTTYRERRRIAYMWYRLPARTRQIYASNNRAFQEWADSIILATLF